MSPSPPRAGVGTAPPPRAGVRIDRPPRVGVAEAGDRSGTACTRRAGQGRRPRARPAQIARECTPRRAASLAPCFRGTGAPRRGRTPARAGARPGGGVPAGPERRRAFPEPRVTPRRPVQGREPCVDRCGSASPTAVPGVRWCIRRPGRRPDRGADPADAHGTARVAVGSPPGGTRSRARSAPGRCAGRCVPAMDARGPRVPAGRDRGRGEDPAGRSRQDPVARRPGRIRPAPCRSVRWCIRRKPAAGRGPTWADVYPPEGVRP